MDAKPQPLPEIVRDVARSDPMRTCLIEAGGRRATYTEVHQNALRWSRLLRDQGVARGDTVATMLPTSIAAIEIWLGIAWLGAIEVPINTAYRGRMLEHVLDDSATAIVLATSDFADVLRDPLAQRESITTLVVAGGLDERTRYLVNIDTVDGSLLPEPLADAELSALAMHELSCILYTSGTTGPSKGVMVSWAQMFATALGGAPGVDVGPEDVLYVPFPLFHVSGKNMIYLSSLAGGHSVLKAQFKTDEFWRDVRDYGCTITLLLGAMANFVYNQPALPDDADNPLQIVTMVPVIADVAAFKERFDVQVTTVFNMTETSCPLTSDGFDLGPAGSCGRPRAGYQVRLVDELDREVPPGVLGELVLRSDEPWTQMAGYWKRPEATVAAWGNQWLHTGDGFIRDDNDNYFFVDRKKDAIRRRGENISSFEVEAQVNEHPAVLECAAVAVASEHSEDEVKVVVVLHEPASLPAADLHAYLIERMPKFMVPRYIEFVDELPKTPTQKIRKVALRADGVTADTWDAATT
ncbi:MAG: AMP-binding protein [Cumulibacter sp.]